MKNICLKHGRFLRLAAAGVCIALCVACVRDGVQPTLPDAPMREFVSFEETLLGILSPDESLGGVVFGPDGRRVAYRATIMRWKERPSGRELDVEGELIVDGRKRGNLLAKVGRPVFSPDGQRIAYQAARAGSVIGEPWDWFVVVDGGPQRGGFWNVGDPIFSPDGAIVAYPAQLNRSGPWVMVVGNRIDRDLGRCAKRGSLAYDRDGGLSERPKMTFHPETRQMAYVASEGGLLKSFIALGHHKLGDEFFCVDEPTFSADGREFAYAATVGQGWFIVTGNQRGEPFDRVGEIVFSPDGRILAYVAEKEGQRFVVAGGEKGEAFQWVGRPVFSSTGKRFAYPAKVSKESVVIVVNRTRGEEFDSVGTPVFSPDGDRVAYAAMKGDEAFIVVGNKKGSTFPYVEDPVFSPDGRVVAYTASRGPGMFVIIGKNRSDDFDSVWTPIFSRDGKKLAFGAQKGKELWWKVIDVK